MFKNISSEMIGGRTKAPPPTHTHTQEGDAGSMPFAQGGRVIEFDVASATTMTWIEARAGKEQASVLLLDGTTRWTWWRILMGFRTFIFQIILLYTAFYLFSR